jgi:hypothetical protein
MNTMVLPYLVDKIISLSTRREGEEGEDVSSRMCLESQNLRTPPGSDDVTDTSSSGNGLLLPL